MKLSEISAEMRPIWNKRYLRFKRRWIKSNPGKNVDVVYLYKAFCEKHKIEDK
jgi:hypothetical protein